MYNMHRIPEIRGGMIDYILNHKDDIKGCGHCPFLEHELDYGYCCYAITTDDDDPFIDIIGDINRENVNHHFSSKCPFKLYKEN